MIVTVMTVLLITGIWLLASLGLAAALAVLFRGAGRADPRTPWLSHDTVVPAPRASTEQEAHVLR